MPGAVLDKLIISDTSCLIAFTNIGRFDILKAVCQSVIVTEEVAGLPSNAEKLITGLP